jgi:hypothetical protein
MASRRVGRVGADTPATSLPETTGPRPALGATPPDTPGRLRAGVPAHQEPRD